MYNSIDENNCISNSEKLDRFVEIFINVRKDLLFLIFGKILNDLEPPELASSFELLASFLTNKSKKDLKQQNNLNILPQICKRMMDTLILERKAQFEGYYSFVSFASNVHSNVKFSINTFEMHYKVFESKVISIFQSYYVTRLSQGVKGPDPIFF